MPEDAAPLRHEPPQSGWRPPPPLGERLRPVARVLFGLLGIALTLAGFVRFATAFEDVRRHNAIPLCTAAAKPDEDCATRVSGRVTKKHKEGDSDSTNYLLTVARETAPTAEYDVGKAFYDDVAPGTTIDLNLLHGKVVEIGYHGHRSRTETTTPWADIAVLSALIAAGTALVITQLWPPGGEMALVILLGTVAANMIATLLGALSLISLQWPLLVTLAIALLCWVCAAALFRGVLNEFPPAL